MKRHLLLFFCGLLLNSSWAFAATILKAEGKKVYIQFSPEDSFAEGDVFYITSKEGKKIGLVSLARVKGYKAIGVLRKGKAVAGGGLEFRGAAKSKTKSSTASSSGGSSSSSKKSSEPRKRWGALLGYGMATQDVTDIDTAQTFSLDGSSMAIKGLYDYPFFEKVTIRGLLGTEIFAVSGEGPVTEPTIATDVTYIVGDVLLKWDFYQATSTSFYAIGGMGLYYPMSKSSTAIDPDSLTSFMIGQFGAGMEFKFDKFSIPLEASYYYFPAGETVKTSVISVKTGILF